MNLKIEDAPLSMEAEKEEEALAACQQSQGLSSALPANSISSVSTLQSKSAHSAGLDPIRLRDPNQCIPELNRRYAVVNAGTKVMIIDEWGDPYFEISVEAFHGILASAMVQIGKQAEPVSKYWFRHQGRRLYEKGAIFAPEGNVRLGQYNTWKGFAVEPDPTKSCVLFLKHLLEVVCSGDMACYQYLLSWLAHMVQSPGNIPGVAIVLGSGQGSGKSMVPNYVGRIYGKNYMTVTNKDHLFGKFADHLNEVILLFADEMSWSTSKTDTGLLKVLITEEARTTEKKNGPTRTVKSFNHLIIASNDRWVVPTELSDRRFFILDVAESRVGDFAYFDELVDEMDNGGPDALLAFLQAMDVSSFNPRNFPRTKARVAQQLQSLEPIIEWLFQFADIGAGPLCPGHQVPDDGWPAKVVKAEFYNAYCQWRKDCRKAGSPEGINQFTTTLKAFGFATCKMPIPDRLPGYSVPTLEGLRQAFDDALGNAVDWDPI